MKLIDLKLNKSSRPENVQSAITDLSENKYPYGTEISFENETLTKLGGLKELNVGDKVVITGEGTVTRKSEQQQQEKTPDITASIQIEKISVEPMTKDKPMTIESAMQRVESIRSE